MDFFDVRQIYYIVRIVIAGICGIFIGLERKNRSKEAGTTHRDGSGVLTNVE